MNQEKIRAAIMEQIELLPINDDGQTCTYFPDELADKILHAIAPHLEAGVGWEDAPEWALWRTVDRDGTITYWDMEPYKSYGEENWKHQNARVNFKEIRHFHTGWENSLEQRPR